MNYTQNFLRHDVLHVLVCKLGRELYHRSKLREHSTPSNVQPPAKYPNWAVTLLITDNAIP